MEVEKLQNFIQTYGEQYFNDTWIKRYFLFSTFDGSHLYEKQGGIMNIAGARLNGISEFSQILDFDKLMNSSLKIGSTKVLVEDKRILFGFPSLAYPFLSGGWVLENLTCILQVWGVFPIYL